MDEKRDPGLTPRQLQVARLVRQGLTDRQVAARLFITRRTAEWHLKQVFDKLGVSSRSQVAAWVAYEQAVANSATEGSGKHRHNLPLQLTTFIGRRSEQAKIAQLLTTKRLVTLTAVGGAGKTRLALEVASRVLDSYPDGIWLVDLTLIKDGQLVARAFASALGLHERPHQPIAQSLLEHLHERRTLLVVDNCEHVIEGCADLLASILRLCPRVSILATSREPLRVSGETVWRVASLAIPLSDAPIELRDLAQLEAIALFVDRAQLAAPGFELNVDNAAAVAELCRRLDGIPLAIELAAARVDLISPDQMLHRLENRFKLLTGGSRTGAARHRTLQSTLDWSHDLLSSQERILFRRLSVFSGSFSLEAIESVCSDDDLDSGTISELVGSLAEKSLVIAAGGESPGERFRILETLQQYAYERLAEAEELDRLRRCHGAFFLSLAEEAASRLIDQNQRTWHQRVADEIGNMRLALEWSAGCDPEANVRLTQALTDFWYIHGLVQEGDGWLNRSLAGYPTRDRLRVAALGQGAKVSYWRDDRQGFSERCHEYLEISIELGDRRGIGHGLNGVGQAAEWQGDLMKARRYYDRALAISTELDDSRATADVLRYLGRLAMKEGDHDRARAYLAESISLFELMGDRRGINFARGHLGLNAVESGDFAEARSQLKGALDIARILDFTIGVATPLMYFAALASAQGRPSRALRLSGASEALAESAGAVPVRLTKPVVERWLTKSRRKLGPMRSANCLAEGRILPRERAIEYAMQG